MDQAATSLKSPQKESKKLGMVALILSIVGFILTVAALQTLIIGLAIGFGGMVVGIIATTQHKGTGMAIAAIVIGFLCIPAAPISCVGHAANNISDSLEKSKTSSVSAGATSAPNAATEFAVVDATAFIAEFDANKIAAQDKYKDKYVQLTGYVSNISGGDVGGIYAVIDPNQGKDIGYGTTVPYYGTNIQCYLEKSDASALANGQKATVKGQVEDMLMGGVQLKNCSVVK